MGYCRWYQWQAGALVPEAPFGAGHALDSAGGGGRVQVKVIKIPGGSGF